MNLLYFKPGDTMITDSASDTERKVLAILKVLSESSESLGSITIARKLKERGLSLSERAVRYHLRLADEKGYTRPLGRDGRMITPRGLEELRVALAPDQLSFILEKIELLAFRTTFDPKKRTEVELDMTVSTLTKIPGRGSGS